MSSTGQRIARAFVGTTSALVLVACAAAYCFL